VVVAMSGGVDSSVAAARLVRQGYDVVGLTLHLWDYPDDGSVRGRCCAPEDQYDARRTADRLGIPHFSFDRRELFQRDVVDPFVDAYLDGTTPSPCVSCNKSVKLPEILAVAERLGAAFIATGHYARIDRVDGRAVLRRAVDPAKDQSYFLHALPQATLAKLLFPLGEATKAEVRAEALALGLPGAEKGESQELCFVPTGTYDSFIEARADGRIRPGPIVDSSGREVGRHNGIHRFTVGQRKGLGVAVGTPAYVASTDAATATVHLGDRDSLLVASAEIEDTVFAEGAPDLLEAQVKIRAHHAGAEATVRRTGSATATIEFRTPVPAVVVGQFAVFYQEDAVRGGGRISRVRAPHACS
jgi:tRNA-uridine 2-sulfurtransferase